MGMRLAVELAPKRKHGLLLANPVLTASGTFGNGLEFVKVFDIQRRNSRAPLDVLEDIEEFMRRQDIDDVQQLIGAAGGEGPP